MHHLKTHPEPFAKVKDGSKTFEHRENDRDFKQGDTVVLMEWDAGAYTGAMLTAKIGYVLHGPEWRVRPGYCIFSLLNVTHV